MNYSYKIKKISGTSLYVTFDSVEFRCFSFKNDEYYRTCLYIIGKNESYSNIFADYLLLYRKIIKDLYRINLFRKEIIECAIKSPKENKLNEEFFDIDFQNRLEVKNTVYPFSNEEGIKYIVPNMPILITDSISEEKQISYHKELFKKNTNFSCK